MSIVIKLINRVYDRIKYRDTVVKTDELKVVHKVKELEKEHKDWAITHGGFDKIPYKGRGERVAVLDTGVDPYHHDLYGQVTPACFIKDCHDTPFYKDNEGHGTFTIGEIVSKADGKGIVGVAPEATGLGGKVLYGNGQDELFTFEKALVDGINFSVKNGCGVISMSLGTSYRSPLIEEALENAVDNGVIPLASAGNDGLYGSLYRLYPAAYPCVISVSVANYKDLPAFFSSAGHIDSLTPEEQPELAIASLEYYWGCLPNNKYGKMIGTSMSCPMAAGVALLWRQAMREKGLLPTGRDVLNSFRAWIKRVVNDTNNNGWDSSLGYGVLLLDEGDV